jgi:hydantoinase/carbamoylase family amidase
MSAAADAPAIDPARVIADLRELDARTGGPGGARRLCWGDGWRAARELLAGLLAELGLEPERDKAGNLWTYLPGEREPALALGSHLDSVPEGGWLDGALGVMAALGVIRAWATAGRRPTRTLALVDWADEEGARFGRSLFGSSAAAGTLDPDELAGAGDAEGRSAAEVLGENGIELRRVGDAGSRLTRVGSYLELHIEQGPVLEAEGAAAAAVTGCVGVERHRFVFRGRIGHAGTTPMDVRRDAGLAAAATALRVEEIARTERGVGTVGSIAMEPGIPTAVPGTAVMLADLRHPEADRLAAMLDSVREAAAACAKERGCEVTEEPVWRIDPTSFDPELVALARRACDQVAGRDFALPSGALHDAAEIARVVPAAMVFSPSIGGISHAPDENTGEDDLRLAIETFGHLANSHLTATAS